ncbi:MAG: LCP family protein [Lachnospiraceae bacterium]|nr:LCP family protein [Lachnospiraceae bacterium]
MTNNSNGNRQKRQGVSIPDFKRETEREYQYAQRPNRPDLREKETGQEYQRRKREEEIQKRNMNRTPNSQISSVPQSVKNKSTSQKRKKRKLYKNILMVSMLCVAVLLGHLLGRVHAQVNRVLNQKKESEIRLDEVVVDESQLDSDDQIINILLVGADKRESWSEAGRSDATMIATIDKKHKRLKLTSLMRDMYVEIPNHGKNKFNAAYSYGGISLLYQTIAYNFDLKIDGYVLVDFAAFTKVIKSLGGVKIELTEAEANYLIKAYKKGTETKVKPGMNNLNGKQALAYTRIRQDAEADFGRTARQRKVLQSLFTKMKTKSYSQLLQLSETVMQNITTDLSNEKIFSYMADVIKMGTTEIDQQRIPLNNTYSAERIGGMEVLVPDLNKNKEALWKFIFEYDGTDSGVKAH